jgi:hypothetical protein
VNAYGCWRLGCPLCVSQILVLQAPSVDGPWRRNGTITELPDLPGEDPFGEHRARSYMLG